MQKRIRVLVAASLLALWFASAVGASASPGEGLSVSVEPDKTEIVEGRAGTNVTIRVSSGFCLGCTFFNVTVRVEVVGPAAIEEDGVTVKQRSWFIQEWKGSLGGLAPKSEEYSVVVVAENAPPEATAEIVATVTYHYVEEGRVKQGQDTDSCQITVVGTGLTELEACQAKLEDCQGRASSLSAELSECEQRVSELQEEKNRLSSQLEACRAELEAQQEGRTQAPLQHVAGREGYSLWYVAGAFIAGAFASWVVCEVLSPGWGSRYRR
ncbi:MAG: hypothetical protein QI223_08145 [Candidatus Korarchaeota archaeon]|nr:hypothetical protein [Candidatus Korarchaeota archaeon]